MFAKEDARKMLRCARGGVKLGKMVFVVCVVKECKWLWGLVVVGGL